MARKKAAGKSVEALRHTEAKRRNIPTAEHQSVLPKEQEAPRTIKYPRNTDLDPQLVWRGKDYQDWSDLVVQAPPLYIQEKIHPKVLIDDLLRRSKESRAQESGSQIDLFSDFNGMPAGVEKTEFYQHDQNWSNRMILGDSLQVMASLAEREGLRGKVQCIYMDPPYGIKFNSNFQWSTTSRDVKDGRAEHITREPEQVKAFRDTWRDGIHSYLTYLRDRLTVARDLLAESGSLFVQIGDENLHFLRAVLGEVFGDENFVSVITFSKTTAQASGLLPNVSDYIVWYARSLKAAKSRHLYSTKVIGGQGTGEYVWARLPDGSERPLSGDERAGQTELSTSVRVFRQDSMVSQGAGASADVTVPVFGKLHHPGTNCHWKTHPAGIANLARAERVLSSGRVLKYKRFIEDFPIYPLVNNWRDTGTGGSSSDPRIYVVQTVTRVVERCLLMTTDPGDLVLDPSCGSGTTAYVAEQWGRRWITVDTSRVALALARARVMGARYPYSLLADSPEGQRKEAEVSGRVYVEKPTYGNVKHGFVYERVAHITLKSIANNAEIEVIHEKWQPKVQEAQTRLNTALRGHKRPHRVTTGGREGKDVVFEALDAGTFKMPSGESVPANALVEWEVPREAPEDWPAAALQALAGFWEVRLGRQREIDASIAAKAEFESLYDRPYEDKKKVRVAGPFTVESVSPHRMLAVDESDELIDPLKVGDQGDAWGTGQTFEQMILENLRLAGVQQAHKEDRIIFTSLAPWPGKLVCAEGRYREGDKERRAGIFIGPEFGTVSRPDLVEAAREAGDAGFDVLVACAFNYEAHAAEFSRLGRVPVLKAHMNADLHMAGDLKATSKGNLFVIFGEPDISILKEDDDRLRVKVNGVDVFDPSTGEVRSDSTEGIACWFLDTNYNEESFFVRHAYFLGQNDPYASLKTTLKAEIDAEAWATLRSDTSRPFDRPKSGRIAVKVINHLGDEVMKVFRV